jgi:hypothetical protein
LATIKVVPCKVVKVLVVVVERNFFLLHPKVG